MITYQIKLELQSERTMFSDIVLTSGDTKAYRLEFSFYSDGVRQNVSGCSLYIRAKRADNSIVLDMGEVTEEGKALYDVTSSVYCVPGKLSLEVALATENGTYVTTKELIMSVREGYGNGGLVAENTTPILAKLAEQSAKAERATIEAEKVAEEAERIINMTVSAEAIDSDSEATVEKVDSGECVSLVFGIPKGKAGHTPQKGIDYFTPEDIESLNIPDQNKLANALKSTASGNTITITDVSPLEHTPKCKVGGKNLLDAAKLVSTTGAGAFVDNGDGTYTFTKDGNKRFSGNVALQTPIPPNTQFVFSGTIVDNVLSRNVFFMLYDKNGQSIASNDMPSFHRVMSFNVEVYSIRLHLLDSEPDGAYVKLRDLQIEVGSVATPFEQFIDPTTVTVTRYGADKADNPQTFTPAPDGTVEIPSLSPTMTILTDTDGVNIECEYNRDINKAFAELQNAIISLGGNV